VKTYKPGEQHEQLTSEAYAKYRDARMPWVGRFDTRRVVQVTDADTILAEANESRVWISLINDDPTVVVYINLAQPAVLNSSLRLNPGGSPIVFDALMPWPDRITAIVDTGLTANVLVCEVSQIVESGRGE
jgi:hypothetical protein